MLAYAIVGLLSLPIIGCAPAQASLDIAPTTLAAQIEQEATPLILDVRTAEEYAEGHVPGAINIDYRELNEQIESIESYANQPVIVYCERGVRAGVATRLLTDAGFSSVIRLRGDIAAWRNADLPVEMD